MVSIREHGEEASMDSSFVLAFSTALTLPARRFSKLITQVIDSEMHRSYVTVAVMMLIECKAVLQSHLSVHHFLRLSALSASADLPWCCFPHPVIKNLLHT